MAELYSIVYMYYNFLIHSSVDGHLGCFYVLGIVNSAAVNTGVHVCFSILVSSVVGLLGHMVVLEKAVATHSSTLAWRIPWREEPGRLQSMGSQRVGYD